MAQKPAQMEESGCTWPASSPLAVHRRSNVSAVSSPWANRRRSNVSTAVQCAQNALPMGQTRLSRFATCDANALWRSIATVGRTTANAVRLWTSTTDVRIRTSSSSSSSSGATSSSRNAWIRLSTSATRSNGDDQPLSATATAVECRHTATTPTEIESYHRHVGTTESSKRWTSQPFRRRGRTTTNDAYLVA